MKVELVEGLDLTDIMGVKKYEPNPDNTETKGKPARGRRRVWPQFLVKTDETRVQGLRDKVLEQMHGVEMYVTEKLDGSSMTVFVKGKEFGVCSRNLLVYSSTWLQTTWLQKLAKRFKFLQKWVEVPTFDPKSHFVKTALKLEEQMRILQKDHNNDFAVQGEIIGPGIQKNKYELLDFEFWIFNVYNITHEKFCDFHEMQAISLRLNTQHVPILRTDFKFLPEHTSDYWVKESIGTSALNKKVQREGIVVRSMEEKDIVGHGRCSFKAINPKFLLKYDE